MRRFIAWFFILLFSTQVIPLTVWSNAMAQTQTVAVSEDSNEEKGASTPKEGKAKKQNTLAEEDYDHVHHIDSRVYVSSGLTEEKHHWPHSLYALFKHEVTTPPPNYC